MNRLLHCLAVVLVFLACAIHPSLAQQISIAGWKAINLPCASDVFIPVVPSGKATISAYVACSNFVTINDIQGAGYAWSIASGSPVAYIGLDASGHMVVSNPSGSGNVSVTGVPSAGLAAWTGVGNALNPVGVPNTLVLGSTTISPALGGAATTSISGLTLPSPTFSGTIGGSPAYSSLTGSGTSCVQASNTGVLSITGAPCGSGGGGGISGLTTGQLSIAGSPTTLTSSVPFSTSSAANTVAEMGSGGILASGMIPAINLAAGGAGGITGNLPVSNLNSGTSASASTFWRGDGTWATPSGGGNVSGPGSSTNLYLPQWSGSSGTLLGVGLPVGLTGNSTVVETTSGGLLTSSLVPAINLGASGAGGVTGNLPIGNLNSGTSASSSTFWRGDGTWNTPSGGGNVSTSGTITTGAFGIWASGTGLAGTVVPGTGVMTALAVNVGSAGAFVTIGGALGTPSSGNLSNVTFPTVSNAQFLGYGTGAGSGAAVATTIAAGSGITFVCSSATCTIAATGGGGGLSGMTAGQVPIAATASTVTSSKPLTGTGGSVASSTGTLISGHCVSIGSNLDLIDAGGACTTGGGGGTVNAGTAGQLTYYGTSTNVVSGNANANISSGALTLGIPTSVLGQLILAGNTSGATTITPPATAGGTLTLPTTTGIILESAGANTLGGTYNLTGTFQAGGNAMTFPGSVATLAGLGVVQSWTALQTYSSGITVSTSLTATGLVTLSDLATQATNTVLVNATSGTASPTAQSVGSCSAAADALIWTTNTGFGCNTAINAATLGGATFAAPGTIGSGTAAAGTFTSLTATGSFTATGLVTLADHATQAANTMVANVSASTASPTAASLPSCSGANQAWNYTSGTGIGCVTLTGGNVSTTGTITTGALAIWASGTTLSGAIAPVNGEVIYGLGGSWTGTSLSSILATPPMIGATPRNTPFFSSLTDTGFSTTTQCVQATSGLLGGTGSPCGTSTAVVFVGGVAGGTANAPTITPTVPTGFTNTAGYIACGTFNTPNTSTSTLAVDGQAALPVHVQTQAGEVALAGGELAGSLCLQLDSTAAAFIVGGVGGSLFLNASAHTVSQSEWAHGTTFVYNASGYTLTVPNLTTTPVATNSGIGIITVGNTVILQAQGTDVIDTGQVGASTAGGTTIIPADINTVVISSGSAGASAFTVPLGPVQYRDLTWAEGLNLSTNARFVGRFATPRVVYGIKCNVQAAGGATSTVHLWSTASGTAPGSGTPLDTTGCNANLASNTEQDMGVAGNPIVAAYTVWATFSGAGTSGNGGLTISYR